MKQKQVHESLYRASEKLESLLDASGEGQRPFVEAVQRQALGVLESGIAELMAIIAKEKANNQASDKAGRQITKI
jgi:hypothetical protein